jgi:hypothetical protein
LYDCNKAKQSSYHTKNTVTVLELGEDTVVTTQGEGGAIDGADGAHYGYEYKCHDGGVQEHEVACTGLFAFTTESLCRCVCNDTDDKQMT